MVPRAPPQEAANACRPRKAPHILPLQLRAPARSAWASRHPALNQAASSASSARLQPALGNELLDYIKALAPEELVALTDCASEDVLEAMNLFVQRLMGGCTARLPPCC